MTNLIRDQANQQHVFDLMVLSEYANDALYGRRGPTFYNHNGNQYMRTLVEALLSQYKVAGRGMGRGKRGIVLTVYNQFTNEGRRFLQQMDEHVFEELAVEIAMEKIQKVFNGFVARDKRRERQVCCGVRRSPEARPADSDRQSQPAVVNRIEINEDVNVRVNDGMIVNISESDTVHAKEDDDLSLLEFLLDGDEDDSSSSCSGGVSSDDGCVVSVSEEERYDFDALEEVIGYEELRYEDSLVRYPYVVYAV
mmetsp:Transcript_36994/g.56840  ORF Transcript_36994/g.56840 Transcript_36994/m.56840 type:complete len:252 (-) Transcript_36994:159-914(-)